MTIADDVNAFEPTQYNVIRLAFQIEEGQLKAFWDVQLRNSQGNTIGFVHPIDQPSAALRTALRTYYDVSIAAFETATGLTEYAP
jgi:hypothetical protein